MSVAASLQVKLDMDSTGFSSGVTAAESRLDKFKNKVDSVSASMRDIGGKATAALTVPIVAGFGSAINAASDLNEATSAVETTYGSAAAAIIASSKNAATAVGQSQEQYLSAATTLGVFGKSAGLTGDDLSGFSNDLLGASGDLASFFNADPSEVLMALQSGLTGETEPLRKYGIMMSDAAIQQEAMKDGIWDGTGAMTEQQKILARQQFIMHNLGPAQGDFARTSDGLANSMRTLKAELKDVSAQFGMILLPYVTKAAAFAKRLMAAFQGLSGTQRKWIMILLGIAAAIGPVLLALGMMLPAISAVGAAMGILLGPIGLIILAIILLAVAWKKNLFDIQGKTAAFLKFIQPAIDTVVTLFTYLKDVISGDIQPGNLTKIPGWLQPIALVLGRVVKTLRVFFKTWQDKGFLEAMKTIPAQIRAFGRAVAGLLESLGLTQFAATFKKVFYDISHVVSDVISLIDDLVHGRWKQVWDDLVQLATDAFHLMIDQGLLIPSLLLDVFNKINWGAIGQALLDGLMLAGAFLVSTGIPWLVTKGGELIGGLLSGAQGYWDSTVSPWLSGLATALPVAVGDVLTALGQKGIDLLSGLLSAAQTYWTETVAPWLLGIGAQAVTAIGDMLTTLYQKGADLFTGLFTGITDTWAVLSAWITTVPSLAVTALGEVTETLYQQGVDFLVGLWNGILFVWDTLSTWLATVPDLIVGAIGDVTGTLVAQGKDLLSGLMSGIAATWSGGAGEGGGIQGWFFGLGAKVASAVGWLGGALYQAGADVMNGLWQGMIDVWNQITNWLSGLNPGAYKGPPARDKKMLINNGELIMGGLGVGLDRGWQDVKRQLSSYAPAITGNTATPRLATMPSGAASGTNARGGGDIHLTVQVDGNVYGIDDLTVEVTKQMMPALADTFKDVRRARGMAT